MKNFLLLTIALFLTALLQAQQVFSKKQSEVQQTVVKMFQALSDRDSTTLKSSCTPEITFYEYGQIWNIDTLVRKAITLNQSPDFKRTNTFEFITTETAKTTALATYRLSSVVTKDSKETTALWLETVALVRQHKRWKIRHLHSTLIRRS